MSWKDDLQPASWRGIGFGVQAEQVGAGRNVAIHDYPFRDKDPVWAEDTGRAGRTISITGFLVGEDVAAQRAAMLDAVDGVAGPGELVHPHLGSKTLSLVRFASSTRFDAGRVVELTFEFVEAGSRIYPEAASNTQAQVSSAATGAQVAAGADFEAKAPSPAAAPSTPAAPGPNPFPAPVQGSSTVLAAL